MKSLLMGLGAVYFAGFLAFGTYNLASQAGWDISRALGYGATWPLQIMPPGPYKL
jgi:hypothetical protein